MEFVYFKKKCCEWCKFYFFKRVSIYFIVFNDIICISVGIVFMFLSGLIWVDFSVEFIGEWGGDLFYYFFIFFFCMIRWVNIFVFVYIINIGVFKSIWRRGIFINI